MTPSEIKDYNKSPLCESNLTENFISKTQFQLSDLFPNNNSDNSVLIGVFRFGAYKYFRTVFVTFILSAIATNGLNFAMHRVIKRQRKCAGTGLYICVVAIDSNQINLYPVPVIRTNIGTDSSWCQINSIFQLVVEHVLTRGAYCTPCPYAAAWA